MLVVLIFTWGESKFEIKIIFGYTKKVNTIKYLSFWYLIIFRKNYLHIFISKKNSLNRNKKLIFRINFLHKIAK